MPLVVLLVGTFPSFVITDHGPPWRARDALEGLVLLSGIIALGATVGHLRAREVAVRTWAVGVVALLLALLAGVWLLRPSSDRDLMQAGLVALLAVQAAVGWHLCRRGQERQVQRWALSLWTALLLTTTWFPSLLVDACWAGPRWAAYQGRVAAALLAALGRDVVVAQEPHDIRPQYLWYWGIGTIPGTWRNRAVADWYGVRSVRVVDAEDMPCGDPPPVP